MRYGRKPSQNYYDVADLPQYTYIDNALLALCLVGLFCVLPIITIKILPNIPLYL